MTKSDKISIGGQAVIEGVVMRSKNTIATALRRKDNTIEIKRESFTSITQKTLFFKLPVIRGFVSLIEVLIIGVKTLNLSASRAELDMISAQEKIKSKKREQMELFISFLVAFVLAFGIFTYLPYQVAYLIRLSEGSLSFNIFTGIVRIIFFITYVKCISFLKDIHRVFEYHGAEHKAVHAFENKEEMLPELVEKYTTIHPRCGTSFVFLVLLVSIMFFSIVDYFVGIYYGVPNIFVRIGYHLLLLPLISGVSYELLKKSEKYMQNPIVKILTFPGMLLQRITTQTPSKDQLEVAIIALCTALDIPYPEADKLNIREIEL